MLCGRFQCVMRVAVSAGLLTMALTPPAVRHVHAGGERQHKHPLENARSAPGIAHSHTDSGTHSHHHPHHRAIVRRERQYSWGGVDHCHFAWLGFEFVLPTPTSPAPSQGDEDRVAQEIVPVFVANDFVDGPQHARAIAAAPLVALALPSIDGLPAEAAPWIAPAGAISNLLCDTARHERSGVQLI